MPSSAPIRRQRGATGIRRGLRTNRVEPWWSAIARRGVAKEHPMLDLIMLAIGLGFFALSVGYTIACDRL
jgi:hypothetical protein